MASRGEEIYAQACEVIPGGVNSAARFVGPPYVIREARGATLIDADGRSYLDFHAGYGPILLGHHDPGVDSAVTEAVKSSSLFGVGVTELELEFARLVVSSIPSVESVITTNSGTEAVIQALRLARAATGRSLIVKFQGGFHGWHDSVYRNVASTPERAYGWDPLSAGMLDSARETTLIAEFNDLASVTDLFERYPEQIAAVILEPVAHNVGSLVPDSSFLSGLRDATRNEGALLIFDEVVTGFRHALGGYQELAGILPDLTTFGKAVANGYAVSGVGGPTRLMEHFRVNGGDVRTAGTFNGNPVGMAAAIATMNYLRGHREEFYERLFRLGDRVREGLRGIVSELGIVGEVAGVGSVFLIYFAEGPIKGYRDVLRNNDAAFVAFHRRMTDRGFFMTPATLRKSHLTGAHTEADVDRTLEAAGNVLKEMSGEGIVD